MHQQLNAPPTVYGRSLSQKHVHGVELAERFSVSRVFTIVIFYYYL